MFADYMVCRTRRLLWTMGFLEPEDCCRLWGSENSTVDYCVLWGSENQQIVVGYGVRRIAQKTGAGYGVRRTRRLVWAMGF